MAATAFVHLHVHSHYSLLDGATRIEALVERAKAFGMPAVALTDHGNMFGAIEFYAAAVEAGIQPIIGCEAYLAVGDRRAKDAIDGNESYHLLLLAMNRTGYQNLMRLASIGYTEGFYRKPRIDKQVLREHSEGLICTSTCIGGEIPQVLLGKSRAAAERTAKTYLEIFGPDRFFVELQDHGMAEQKTLNPELVEMARRLGVATIATNDVHYLEHDDVEAHDVLCCINTSSQLDQQDRFRFPTDQFYFKSAEEMAPLFSRWPESLDNTLHVARMCNLELDLSTRHAPVYRVPESATGADGRHLDDNDYFRQLVYEGATKRYGEITPELRERIDYELEVITSKGFASYFLIVWDCVRYAREHGIPVGARGSGCSAVVSYCLHISSPEPIRYGLFFERFMDPDRDEMPDIDLDICQNGRAQLIEYVRNKYGHVAQIITFGTLKARAAVKDVSRVMGIGFSQANELTKLIPNELHMTLDKALAQEPELKKQYESDPTIRKILDIGRRLEGVARNAGVHAAGVVVADQPLVNFLPLYRASGQETLVTQFDGPTVERVGLLKMDFLGLRTLTTLERARQLAQRSTGTEVDLEHLEPNDPKVFKLFERGETRGIFQFESGGMRDVIMRMKPNRIEDLIAANALFRPGPMEYIPEYVKRKHGARWTTPHPIMSEVLEETYGIMVYQEQVSRVVNRLGGIELKAAFRLAKAISKKKTAMIEAMREPFVSGCIDKGVQRNKATQIFEDILKFGGYAFNKAHSTGYALVAYQTAWMKTYFPVEFMAALLTFEMSSTDKVAEYHEECKQMGLRVEPPCVNASGFDFEVERAASRLESGGTESSPSHQVIRFGLGAIKGVGAKAVAAIAAEREKGGPYQSLTDFCERVDFSAVNRATVEALICAGAFDRTGATRKKLLDSLERELAAGQSFQRDRRSGQMGLFAGEPQGPKQSLRSTPTKRSEEWNESEMLARERAVLGLYITRHPLANHEKLLQACATVTASELADCKDGQEVVIGGMVSSLRTVASKTGRNAGRRLGILTFEDLTGRIEVLVFPDDLDRYRSALAPDVVLFLKGTVDRKREEPSLKLTEAVTADEAPEAFAELLVLSISNSLAMERAVELLNEHKGTCRVFLDVTTSDQLIARIECHPSLRTSCSTAFLQSAADILGSTGVRILGRNRHAIPLPTHCATKPELESLLAV